MKETKPCIHCGTEVPKARVASICNNCWERFKANQHMVRTYKKTV